MASQKEKVVVLSKAVDHFVDFLWNEVPLADVNNPGKLLPPMSGEPMQEILRELGAVSEAVGNSLGLRGEWWQEIPISPPPNQDDIDPLLRGWPTQVRKPLGALLVRLAVLWKGEPLALLRSVHYEAFRAVAEGLRDAMDAEAAKTKGQGKLPLVSLDPPGVPARPPGGKGRIMPKDFRLDLPSQCWCLLEYLDREAPSQPLGVIPIRELPAELADPNLRTVCDEHGLLDMCFTPPNAPNYVPGVNPWHVSLSSSGRAVLAEHQLRGAPETRAQIADLVEKEAEDTPPDSEAKKEPVPRPVETAGHAVSEPWYSAADLAAQFGLKKVPALRQRLKRWRHNNDRGWMEVDPSEQRRGAPKFLYKISAVRDVIDGMKD